MKLCGAIFDAPAKQNELTKLEVEIGDPDFWNQPEKSQRIMQQRKRLEEAIQNSKSVTSATSDIDTLFELAREGENVNGELEREMNAFEKRLEELETGMLLSGENDKRDAIVTIHPGRGRHRKPGLGGDAASNVSALGRTAQIRSSHDRPAGR